MIINFIYLLLSSFVFFWFYINIKKRGVKWIKYVDDLEVSFLPESNILSIRSESRVGESDLGVNQKRVDLLKSKMF